MTVPSSPRSHSSNCSTCATEPPYYLSDTVVRIALSAILTMAALYARFSHPIGAATCLMGSYALWVKRTDKPTED